MATQYRWRDISRIDEYQAKGWLPASLHETQQAFNKMPAGKYGRYGYQIWMHGSSIRMILMVKEGDTPMDTGFGKRPGQFTPEEEEIREVMKINEAAYDRIVDKQSAESGLGRKDDSGKLRWSLIPSKVLTYVVQALEYGAKRYGDDNWKNVPDSRTRYYDAARRHINSWWEGEQLDPESGLPHLSHATCCILFLLWFDWVQGKTP